MDSGNLGYEGWNLLLLSSILAFSTDLKRIQYPHRIFNTEEGLLEWTVTV